MSSESNRQQDGQREQTSNQPQPSLFSMLSNMTRLAYQPADLPAVEGLVQALTGYEVSFRERESTNEDAGQAEEEQSTQPSTDEDAGQAEERQSTQSSNRRQHSSLPPRSVKSNSNQESPGETGRVSQSNASVNEKKKASSAPSSDNESFHTSGVPVDDDNSSFHSCKSQLNEQDVAMNAPLYDYPEQLRFVEGVTAVNKVNP